MQIKSAPILWLLAIATICVTIVFAMRMLDEGVDGDSDIIYVALTMGELSVLCAAMVRTRGGFRVTWVMPFLFALLAASVMAVAYGFPEYGWERFAVPAAASVGGVNGPQAPTAGNVAEISGLERWEPLTSLTAIYWLHVAGVLAVLWLLRSTALFARFANLPTSGRWQFSILHLLVLMTCVAVIVPVLSRAEVIATDVEGLTSAVTLPLANATLLIAALWATQIRHHALTRLAACLAAAMILAAVCEVTGLAFADGIEFFSFAIVQSILLWAWLEVMRPSAATEAGASEPLPAAST